MADDTEATRVEEEITYTNRFMRARTNPNNIYYTPDDALDFIAAHLAPFKRVWECCCGQNHITRYLERRGHAVIATDIDMGHDMFAYAPSPEDYDIIVTNPPFQGKRRILERLYELGKPFAVLMPTMALNSNPVRLLLKADADWGILMPPKSINYIPGDHPDAATLTKKPKGSRSFFHSSWFCHKVPTVRSMVIA